MTETAQAKPKSPAINPKGGSVSGQFMALLEKYKLQISMALPKHLTPERLIQVATAVLTKNPELYKCTPQSVVGAVMESSILGLDPTPEFGQCYFVPYYNSKTKTLEAQFQLGYRGMISLAKRTGEISNIFAYVIHENDDYEIELGINPVIKHKPNLDNPGKMIMAYAVVIFKDGSKQFEVMTKRQIMMIKARSKSKDSKFSPWNADENSEEEMWRKTVLKRLLKYVPLSSEYRTALEADSTIITPDAFSGQGALDLSKVEKDYIEGDEEAEDNENPQPDNREVPTAQNNE